mgnify:FL=1
MKKLLPFLSAAILLTSCAVKKQIKEDQTLLNGNWELASASFSKDLSKDFKEGLPTLNFDSTDNLAVFGYDGCNRINTKATLKKDQGIVIDQELRTTMMACNKVKSNEYQNALKAATTYDLKNNVLILKSETSELKFYKVSLNGNLCG